MTKYSLWLLTFACVATLATSSCSNTFDGAGRDIQNMGGWVEDTF